MPNIPTWSDLLSSPAAMRRLMRAWPPYAAAGIRMVEIADDWSRCVMELRLRPWTANFVGTQFGGSMFSMTDPWWMILMMRRLGPGYVVWDKAAEIEFVAPGRGDVRATFELTDEMVGAGAGGGSASPETATVPRDYSPDKVGNDASARPWERNGMAFDASRQQQGTGSLIGSGLSGSQNWGIPEGFDAEGFLTAAKRNFITLQSAWDRSDIATLRSMMTDSMLDEIRTQLTERETRRGDQPNQTDVVMIEAQLLGIEELDDGYMASVEFSGMIREELSAGPSPFREVWNMTKAKAGNSGWLVAGVQALQ